MKNNSLLSGGNMVSAWQVLDKDLYSRGGVFVFSYPQWNDKFKLREVKKGVRVGKVYSYVYGKDKDLNPTSEVWWMLYPVEGGKYEYVKHTPKSFDFKSLQQQGTLTIPQEEEKKKEEEEEDKGFFEKLEEDLVGGFQKTGKTILWIGGSALALYLGLKLYGEYKRQKLKVP